MKTKEYRIIKEQDLTIFEARVSAHLNDKWKCVGGMSQIILPNYASSSHYYAQAVVKENDEELEGY